MVALIIQILAFVLFIAGCVVVSGLGGGLIGGGVTLFVVGVAAEAGH